MPESTRPEPREGPDAESGEPQTASAVLDDVESLRDRLGQAERQRDEYLAQLQRARADFENYRKRGQQELAEERRYAHSAFAGELLPALDNLERAIDAAAQ